MVWGCFCASGVGRLKIFDKNVNAEEHIDTLEHYYKPSLKDFDIPTEQCILVEDKAPAHNSKKAKNYRAGADIQILEWPGNSPDLNPIENIWSILKTMVALRIKPGAIITVDELWKIVQDEWYLLGKYHTEDLLKPLARSMKNRIAKVLAVNGESIDY